MTNFWQNKKVLVTGGSGFIGSNVVNELIKRRAKVIITVFKKNKIEDRTDRKIKIEKADLTSFRDCLRVTRNIDIVLNFAALDGGANFKKEHGGKIYRVNTEIVKNVLEASMRNKVDRVLLMSSIDVYPKDIKLSVSEEDAGMNSKGGYVGSKVFSEKLAKKYHDKYGLKIAIARSGNVYGLGDETSPERARVIPAFIKKAANNEDIEISNRNKFSFLHVSDLINALLDLTEKYAVCDPVNLVGSERVNLKVLAEIIIKISNSNSKIVNKSNGLIRDIIISTKKAKKLINFKEKVRLKNGLRLLIGA